jgi:hypothetical protein
VTDNDQGEEAKDDGQNLRTAQESSRDLAKLLVSLASAVVVLSATFAEKFSEQAGYTIIILFVAWLCLAASVVFGVTAISNLVHAQWTLAENWGTVTFTPMKRSWIAFQIGMVSLLLYAGVAAGIRAFHEKQPVKELPCCRVPDSAPPKAVEPPRGVESKPPSPGLQPVPVPPDKAKPLR